jgi:hypothetical protein
MLLQLLEECEFDLDADLGCPVPVHQAQGTPSPAFPGHVGLGVTWETKAQIDFHQAQ